MRRCTLVGMALLILTALPSPAHPCTLCLANLRSQPTMRLEANQPYAKLVVYGRIIDSSLDSRIIGKGTSKFKIDALLKKADGLPQQYQVKEGDTLTLPRYIPIQDSKNPPQYLVFCDIDENVLDVYRGDPVTSNDAAKYLAGVLRLDPKKRKESLLYFFNFLQHEDPKISTDAFLEFARASDAEVGAIAPELPADKIRQWLKSEKTPSERIGLYSFLLGACGNDKDAKFLGSILANPNSKQRRAYDGILSGYMKLRPDKGWKLAYDILGDGKASIPIRLAIHRALQFYHGWQPEKSKPQVQQGLKVILQQQELADLAVESLREWQWWDLTKEVLYLWGTGGLDRPILKRGIIRYALSCPKPDAKKFLQRIGEKEKRTIQEIRRQLENDQISYESSLYR